MNEKITVKLNDIKKLFGDKKVEIHGKVKTSFSMLKARMFVPKFRAAVRHQTENRLKKALSKEKKYQEEIEKMAKELEQAENAKHAENIAYYKEKIAKLNEKLKKTYKYINKIEKLDEKDADYYSMVFKPRLQKHYYSTEKEALEEKRRLAHYFVNGSFQFGNEVIPVKGATVDEPTVGRIIRKFRKAEYSKTMKIFWENEAVGRLLLGSDFVRKFYSLNYDNRLKVIAKLGEALKELPGKLPENYDKLSLKEKIEALKEAGGKEYALLPFVDNLLKTQDIVMDISKDERDKIKKEEPRKMLDPAKEQKVYNSEQKIQPATTFPNKEEVNEKAEQPTEPIETVQEEKNIQKNDQPVEPIVTVEKTDIKELAEEKVEIPAPEKDEYTVAIENAQLKQDEIRKQMSDVRKKFERKVQDATTFYQNDPDVIYSIREANVSQLNEELKTLDEQLAVALQEEQDAFLARRQEKIEADKKAREERINEINKNAKEKWEKEQKDKEVQEAKNILSHLETSNGTYDISNMTDEEILETYNSIKESPSMAERIEKAKESAEIEKNKESEEPLISENQEKIEADKKAHEERINEKNKNAKEKWEKEQKDKELQEAKNILSHLETSNGTYDISNMTDEEILEIYNRAKESPSMAERIEKAKESAEIEKNKESEETSTAPKENVEENKDVQLEKTEESISQPEVELKGLYEEEKNKLAEKANEQNTNQEKVQEMMDRYGIPEEQAMQVIENPALEAELQTFTSNPSMENNQAKTR